MITGTQGSVIPSSYTVVMKENSSMFEIVSIYSESSTVMLIAVRWQPLTVQQMILMYSSAVMIDDVKRILLFTTSGYIMMELIWYIGIVWQKQQYNGAVINTLTCACACMDKWCMTLSIFSDVSTIKSGLH